MSNDQGPITLYPKYQQCFSNVIPLIDRFRKADHTAYIMYCIYHIAPPIVQYTLYYS